MSNAAFCLARRQKERAAFVRVLKAVPQSGPTGDRAVRAVERGAAEQPKCDHPNDLRGRTRA